ncbi:FCD domain-containing protein [Pelistega sp. NLN82]|uniref:FCD domain-containing protein n=1 Tax=Pelistega ratti TaxID=2652177 RepID=A0A6L9Y3F7_9BURK|nr:FCD domain-containing protein [Pelistega ratti]NEN74911.1 FCD domain-containing protein [Pelistega ratti]
MVATESLIASLCDMIQSQGIEVGDRLPAERKLCEMLSVSRTRLRELLKQLMAQGIIETKVGSGTFLKQNPVIQKMDANLHQVDSLLLQDPDYRFDVQEARAVLESGAAWYAALRATDEEKNHIRAVYKELQHYQNIGDLEKAAHADAKFHLAIAEASHNIVLIQLMRNVFELLRHNVVLARHKMYTDTLMVDQLNHQHSTLLTAIEQKDATNALKSVQQHIHYVIDQVKQIDEEIARQERKNRLKKF